MAANKGSSPRGLKAAGRIGNLKADNARRTAAMDTAAKAGVKLSGSRYEDGKIPSFTAAESAAIAAYSKTAGAKADADKAKASAYKRASVLGKAQQSKVDARRGPQPSADSSSGRPKGPQGSGMGNPRGPAGDSRGKPMGPQGGKKKK